MYMSYSISSYREHSSSTSSNSGDNKNIDNIHNLPQPTTLFLSCSRPLKLCHIQLYEPKWWRCSSAPVRIASSPSSESHEPLPTADVSPGYMGDGGPGLSEENINRVVFAVKTSLRTEIKELVENEVSNSVNPLIEHIDILESENRDLPLHIDDVEQYGRRSLVRFCGISEDQEEDTTAKVRPTDVKRSHRVGKPKQQTDRAPAKPRPIIMRLKSIDAKFRLLKSSKAFRDSDRFSNVSVNEDLTRYRNELAYYTRKLSKARKIQQTWTTYGKGMVKDNSS